MPHHDAAHTGYTADSVKGPVRVAWKTSFEGTPVATCVEPIAAEGCVFVGALNGTLYAVRASDGLPAWTLTLRAPIVHSPAYSAGRLYVACLDGSLYCLKASTGEFQWRYKAEGGGFAVSPTVVDGVVYAGTRGGTMYAVRDGGKEGTLVWRYVAPAPILQTAAVAKGRVYFMAEDMVARCLEAETGRQRWISLPATGVGARDYYPCVFGDYVVFRTRPAVDADEALSAGARALAEATGKGGEVDAARARVLGSLNADAVDQAVIDREAAGVRAELKAHPAERTFYAYRADNGATIDVPVLWTGGDGGVGAPPARDADGSVLFGWRSLYTGWLGGDEAEYRGPAARYGVGLLDPSTGKVTRLPPDAPGHAPEGGSLPADEATAMAVGGGLLYLVRQDTLAAFDLSTHKASILAGKPGTWGGEAALAWSANEWRGPARGGIAISGGRLYWLTGGYLIALETVKR